MVNHGSAHASCSLKSSIQMCWTVSRTPAGRRDKDQQRTKQRFLFLVVSPRMVGPSPLWAQNGCTVGRLKRGSADLMGFRSLCSTTSRLDAHMSTINKLSPNREGRYEQGLITPLRPLTILLLVRNRSFHQTLSRSRTWPPEGKQSPKPNKYDTGNNSDKASF